MPKIPDYPSKTTLNANDILVTDGPEGTKHARIGDVVDDLAALMGDDTLSEDGKLAPADKVGEAIEALGQAESANAENISEIKSAVLATKELAFTIAGTGYVRATDGTVQPSSQSSYTNLIDVSTYISISYKRQGTTSASTNAGMAFYDENMTFLSGNRGVPGQSATGYIDELYTVDVPENAVYAQFTTYTDTATYGRFYAEGVISAVPRIDESLSISGAAADAEKTGEKIDKKTVFRARSYASNESGLYSISSGGIDANTGANTSSTKQARTGSIVIDSMEMVAMTDDTYNISQIWTYSASSVSSAVRKIAENQRGTKPIIVDPAENETRIRISFSFASDADHEMTAEDMSAISERLRIYKMTDDTFTLSSVPADSYTLGIKGMLSRGTLTSENDLDDVLQRGVYYWTSSNPPAHAPFDTTSRMIELGTDKATPSLTITQIIWSARNEMCYRTTRTASGAWNDFVYVSNAGDIAALQAALENMIDDRTIYTIGQDDLLWNFGGLMATGKTNEYTTRIRIINANGLAAIPVRAGTSITANDGYKFNIAEYSYFRSNSDFELIGYRTMLSEPYTVAQDCYIRVSVGTMNDAELWTADADSMKSFTAAGEAAKNGIVLNIIDGTVKERVTNIEKAQEAVCELGEIPINAVSYHALWDDMVANGEVERELISRIGNDANLPVYLYKIRNDMDHIAPDYSIVQWDGQNELYARPKVFLTGSIHGNERTPAYAIYDMVDNMLHDTQYRFMLNAFEWYVVPLVNPWGFSHSARLRSSGAIDKGSDYSSSTISNYIILDNSEAVHQGIRRNSAGIDANRDFANFETQEAQNIRTAVNSILSPGEKFAFAIDAHQAQKGNYINVIGAFLSLHYGASEEAKKLIFSKWMEAGSVTEKLMADYVDVEKHQSIYPWDGTNLMTMRNYMAAYADYAMCFEGGQTCVYYSGSTEWSNPIARALFNTQYHEFLKILSEKLS